MSRSHSTERVKLAAKFTYLAKLLATYRQSTRCGHAHRALQDCRGALDIYQTMTGRSPDQAHVLEIGFGARPFRAFAFQSLTKSITAVDLEQPVFHAIQGLRVWRSNGLERALKSSLRTLCFDWRSWHHFHRDMLQFDPDYDPKRTRLVVADAGDPGFWASHPGPYDLIYSEDVFEHIPPGDLDRLLAGAARHLAPGGLLLTRPMIFTGISGGHQTKWYPERIRLAPPPSQGAWSHLRDPNFFINTYLNKMSRGEMVNAIGRKFDILEDTSLDGFLGLPYLEHLSNALIAHYGKYELLSNKVQIIGRKIGPSLIHNEPNRRTA